MIVPKRWALVAIFAIIEGIFSSSSHGQTASYQPVFKPTVDIKRAAGEIKVDAEFRDQGWAGAAMIDHFVENEPGDMIEPPVKTKAFLTYDNDKIYVAIICFDNPDDIRASWCERDLLYSDDNVGFFFDTYGNSAWGYTLNVNPYGIQADALFSAGYGEDSQFDLVWESAGKITDSGYQVEMAIPFSSLRFPRKAQQTWKIEFWRHHYRASHHNISWAAYDRNEQCWACQWGTMTGLENVTPGRGIELIPSVIGYQAGNLIGDGIPESPLAFDNGEIDGEISANLKYAVSSDFTVEATANPDFSQVEADPEQIDVNSTTALQFPEKRPFFQEGSDLFRSTFGLVYSRSINDPNFGLKATARWGKLNLAYLGAQDENSPMLIPFEEGSSPIFQVGRSFSNIFRLRQSLGNNSRIGAFVTDRRLHDGGSGTVFSVDGNFRLRKGLQLDLQGVLTHTGEPDDTALSSPYVDNTIKFDGEHTAGFDGESFWGKAYSTDLVFETRNFYSEIFFYEKGKTYRADNGYQPTNNRRYLHVNFYPFFRFNEGLLEAVCPQVIVGEIWNMDGQAKKKWVEANLETSFRMAQLGNHILYGRYSEKFAGLDFDDIWLWHTCLSARPNYLIGLDMAINYGHQIAYRYSVMSRQLAASASVELRPIDHLLWEIGLNHTRARRLDNDLELYRGYVFTSRLNVQFNSELSFRFLTQYNDFQKTWDMDPLLTYRMNPFTLFYVGSTYDYQKIYDLNSDESLFATGDEPRHDSRRLTSRQFFAKLQYLFQL